MLSDSENFGHSIFEAISSGCIPIVTSQSPWKKEINKYKCGLSLNPNDNMADKKIFNFIKKVSSNKHKVLNSILKLNKEFCEMNVKLNYKKLFD